MNIRLLPAVLLMVSTAALVEAASAGTALIDAAAYPGGPLWRDGKLLYVEYAGPGIKQWDGQHSSVFWRGEHCGASGLIAYRRDHILVACYDANAIIDLDGAGTVYITGVFDQWKAPFPGAVYRWTR